MDLNHDQNQPDMNFTVKFFPQQQPQSFQDRVAVVMTGFMARIERCELGELEASLYLAYGGIGALHLIGILTPDGDRLWRDRAQLAALTRGWRGGANSEAVRARIAELEEKIRSGR